jgi:hypothetical protein
MHTLETSQTKPTTYSISCGISVILTIALVGIICLPSKKDNWWIPLTTTILVYFTLFFACYSVFAVATTVDMFHQYKVNYQYIFKIKEKVDEKRLYSISLKLWVVFCLSLLMQITVYKFGISMIKGYNALPTAICLLIFIIIMFNPCSDRYPKYKLLFTVKHILMSPFVSVSFE